MIGRLIGILIIVALLLHGYFFLAFGTFDPCAAATFKVLNKTRPQTEQDSLLFSGTLENKIRSMGLVACYRIAITGQTSEIPK